jgi:hypothetical protein
MFVGSVFTFVVVMMGTGVGTTAAAAVFLFFPENSLSDEHS